MKKKVMLLITKSNWGGAQRYVYDIATHLPSDRFEVIVVAGGNGLLFEKLKGQNIPTTSIPFMGRDISLSDEIKGLWFLFRLICKEKPDILHLNSPKIGGLGAVAARLCGIKKIVYTIHGHSFNERRPVWQITAIKFFSWLTLFLMTDVIALTPLEKNQVASWPFLGRKIAVIPLAITSPNFVPQPAAKAFLYEKAGIPVDTHFSIISIGELTKNKDYQTALRAVEKLSFPFHYFIIGEGEDRERLQMQIQSSTLQNRIHLLGFVENASIYLKGADLFLLSSEKEGMPYVILEALAAEVPLISTDVGSVSEYVAKERLVPIHNETALARKISSSAQFENNIASSPSFKETLAQIIHLYLS